MSGLITLGELKEKYYEKVPALCGLSRTEFASLANEGANILYNRLDNTPLLKEFTVETVTDVIDIDTKAITSVSAFKVDCKTYSIVPIVETFKVDRAGFQNFVDIGLLTPDSDIRQYQLPESLKNKSGSYDYEVSYLARIKIPPAEQDSDVLPISSSTAIKNAMIALVHQNNSDPNNAMQFWQMANEEALMQESKFRGPVYPKISLHDSNQTVIENII